MSIFLCDQCKSPLHGSPWTIYDPRGYIFCCTSQCKEAMERTLERERIAQQSMKYGRAAFNGAD